MSTHNIPFPNMKKKIIINYPNMQLWDFPPRDPKNEFETAIVNEPSVFEPLKFYCIQVSDILVIYHKLKLVISFGADKND